MNYKKIIAIIFFCLFTFVHAYPAAIAIVLSGKGPYVEEALTGIKNGLSQKSKDISWDIISVDDSAQMDSLRTKKYSLVCIVGSNMDKIIASVPGTPVVFSGAIDSAVGEISTIRQKYLTQVTGVFLAADPQRQMSIVKTVFPDIKKIYAFHDGISRNAFNGIAGNSFGIDVAGYTLETPNKVPSTLNSLEFKDSEVFWVLPDPTIYNTDSLAYIFNYSAEKRVPMIGFALNTVRAGAVLGYILDYNDMGHQTADIIGQILDGASPKDIEPQYCRKVDYVLNLKAAQNLGIKLAPAAVQGAAQIIK